MNVEQCFQCDASIAEMPPVRLTVRVPGKTTHVNFCSIHCCDAYTTGREVLRLRKEKEQRDG